jgi:hypothetical protein
MDNYVRTLWRGKGRKMFLAGRQGIEGGWAQQPRQNNRHTRLRIIYPCGSIVRHVVFSVSHALG